MEADVTDEVFNIASGDETSLNDLALTLLRVMQSDQRPQYGPARKVNPVPRRLADTSRAARMIGFRAQVALEDGLRRLVAWWAADALQNAELSRHFDRSSAPMGRLAGQVAR
jgi:UDP-glucose 4-epimerase